MASYVRCLFLFFILAISLCLQTHARESKFFSKVTKTKKQSSHDDSISISPAISPSLAPSPSPEPEVVEHGYGLYGRDPYEFTPSTTETTHSPILGEENYVPVDELSNNKLNGNGNDNENKNGNGNEYHHSPTTSNPTRTPVVGEEKYVPVDELSSNKFYGNGNEYQYPPTTSNPTKTPVFGEEKYVPNAVFVKNNNNGNGASGLRVLDNERFSFKNEGNRNGYVSEKQGMSDSRFLENGKYYYDIEAEKDAKKEQTAQFNGNSFENERFQEGINGNGNGYGYGAEKQGISDTRFLENGKYYYDIQSEKDAKKEQTAQFNGNSFENERFYENGNGYGAEKQGMSDTRFLDTGKYWYDVSNEKDAKKEQTPQFNANYFGNEEFEDEHVMDKYGQNEGNGYETEKQGMSDTRFLENGKYYYDLNNESPNSNNNKNGNNGYGNEEDRNEGRNEFVAVERGGYNYNGNTKKLPNYGSTKKLPNTYDTMEEYDREQGYIDPKDAFP